MATPPGGNYEEVDVWVLNKGKATLAVWEDPGSEYANRLSWFGTCSGSSMNAQRFDVKQCSSAGRCKV